MTPSTPLREFADKFAQQFPVKHGARDPYTSQKNNRRHAKQFLDYIEQKGYTPTTWPSSVVHDYFRERPRDPITTNNAMGSVKYFVDFLSANGVAVGTVDWPEHVRNKVFTPRSAATMPEPESSEPVVPADTIIPANVTVESTTTVEPANVTTIPTGPATVPPPAAPPPVTAAPVIPLEQPKRGRGPAKRDPLAGKTPAAGRVRIYRRARESDGVDPGTRIFVGNYAIGDVATEAGVAEFLRKYIQPARGPFPGEQPITYECERLSPQHGGVEEMFPITLDAERVQAGSGAAPSVTTRALANQAAEDRAWALVDRMQAEHDKKIADFEKKLDEAKSKGVDPTVLMMLMQQKPEPFPRAQIMSEIRAMLGSAVSHEPPPPPAPSPFGGLGGLPLFDIPRPPEPRNDGELMSLIRELVQREKAPAEDATMKMLTMMKMMKDIMGDNGANQTVAMLQQQIADLNRKLDADPKSKDVRTMIGDIKEVLSIRDLINGDGGGGGLLDKVMENPEGVASIISAVLAPFAGAAPRLPAPPSQQQQQQQQQAPQTAAPTATAAPLPPRTIPVAAQQAIRAMCEIAVLTPTTDEERLAQDQTIFEKVRELMAALYMSGDPRQGGFRDKFEAIKNSLSKAATPSEVRALVPQIFAECGARKFAAEPVVKRIGDMLVTHYSFIHETITGTKKELVEPAPITPAGAPKPPEEQQQAVAGFDAVVPGKVTASNDGEDDSEDDADDSDEEE